MLVLEDVYRFIEEHPGVTVRVIAEHFGLYPQYVYKVLLTRLEVEGYLLMQVPPSDRYQVRGRGRRATVGLEVFGGLEG